MLEKLLKSQVRF